MFTSISGALVTSGDTIIIKDGGKVYRYRAGNGIGTLDGTVAYRLELENHPKHTKARFREYRISPPRTIRRKKSEIKEGAPQPAPRPRQILS